MGIDHTAVAGFGIEVCASEVISAFGLDVDCECVEEELDDSLVECVECGCSVSGNTYLLLLLKPEFVNDFSNLSSNIEKMKRYLTDKGFEDTEIKFFKEVHTW